MFLSQCDNIYTHNNKRNSSSAYFNLYIFWKQTGRQKILDPPVAGISCVQSALNLSVNLNFDLSVFFPNI